jgi:hypothetical protein
VTESGDLAKLFLEVVDLLELRDHALVGDFVVAICGALGCYGLDRIVPGDRRAWTL